MSEELLDDLSESVVSNKRIPTFLRWLKVMMVLQVFALVYYIINYQLSYQYIYYQSEFNRGIFNLVSTVGSILMGFILILTIANGILFIRWMWRAYANFEKMNVVHLKYNKAATIWVWFVPFVSFILPYFLMKDYVQKLEEIVQMVSKQRIVGNIGIGIIQAWWLTYVVAAIIPWIIYIHLFLLIFSSYSNVTIGSFDSLFSSELFLITANIVSTFLYLISGGVLIKLLKQVDIMEQELVIKQQDLMG